VSEILPLVILPGVNSGAYLFAGAEQALGRPVFAFDPPGIGHTSLPLPFSVKAYAKQVEKFLHKKGVPRVDVMGHSMGGFAAQELARLAGPRVRKLVLVSTGCGQPQTSADMMHLGKVTGHGFWPLMRLVSENPEVGMAWFFSERFVKKNPEAYKAFLAERARYLPNTAVSLAHFSAGGSFSSVGWVGELMQEALVIHGTEDLMVSAVAGKELAARLPDARYLELFGVGHFPMLEHEKFYAYVRRFLEGEVLGERLAPVEDGMLHRLLRKLRL